jgi:DNA-binding XRE family transcriptional regulator
MTQTEAANELGVNVSTLRNWELGRTFPTANMMAKLCELYHTSIEEIFLTKQ